MSIKLLNGFTLYAVISLQMVDGLIDEAVNKVTQCILDTANTAIPKATGDQEHLVKPVKRQLP